MIERLKALETHLKESKKAALAQAMYGKIPRNKHALVMELADSLPLTDIIELSDPADATKKVKRSSIDVLIELFKMLPIARQLTDPEWAELKDADGNEIDSQKMAMKL